MIQNICEQLGLTSKEYETYKTLLSMGEVPVYDIVNKTGDHPQVVYRALEGLTLKGLVQSSVKRRRKYVLAEDPSILKNIAEKRINEVESVIPELRALRKEEINDTLIKTYKAEAGIRDIRARIVDELDEGETFYVIGGSGERFYEIMGRQLNMIEKKRITKKIIRKVISYESQRAGFEKSEADKELSEYRYLPQGFSVPSSTCIYKNKVAVFVFASQPAVIIIESREVAESYMNYFNSLWIIAKP